MSTVPVHPDSIYNCLQSALCLLDEGHALVHGARDEGAHYIVNTKELHSFTLRAQRLADQIAQLAPLAPATQPTFDRQPPATTPVVSGASSSPRLSLSSSSAPETDPETTPPARPGNGACGCSPRHT